MTAARPQAEAKGVGIGIIMRQNNQPGTAVQGLEQALDRFPDRLLLLH